MILPRYSYLLAGLIPHPRVKIYPDAAHGFLFQHHDEFATDVDTFLADASGHNAQRLDSPASTRMPPVSINLSAASSDGTNANGCPSTASQGATLRGTPPRDRRSPAPPRRSCHQRVHIRTVASLFAPLASDRSDRGDDVRIRPAAAEIAAHELADLLVGAGTSLFEQRDGRHDLPRRARAALTAGAAALQSRPSSCAADHSSAVSPFGSAAANARRVCVAGGKSTSRLANASSSCPVNGTPVVSGSPSTASAEVQARGSSSNASGFPRVSAMIRSLTARSTGLVTTESNSVPASSVCRPASRNSGSPASSSSWPASRDAMAMQIRSACSRRLTKPMVWSDDRSSHWHHRRSTSLAVRELPTPPGRAPPARRASDRADAQYSVRTPAPAHHDGEKAGPPEGRPRVHKAAVTPRRRAPSPIRRRQLGRPNNRAP